MADVNPRCCLCQKDKKNEPLTSPPTHHVPEHDGYTMVATNIPLFNEINALSLILDPSRPDEDAGIEAMQRRNEAKYHMSCWLFNNTKLDCAKKR